MLRLKGYLKPFIFMIILTIALLFVQALCDLNLPNLMADIVNVGIQQGGIENAVPEAMSADAYELMSMFMTSDEKLEMESYYTRAGAGDEKYASKYPLSATEDIYIKNDDADIVKIDKIMGRASYMLVLALNQLKEQENGGGNTQSGDENTSRVHLEQITGFFPALKSIPAAQYNMLREKADSAGEAVTRQTGISFVRAFYDKLGMNISELQSKSIFGTGLNMLLIALLSVIATVFAGLLASRVAAGCVKALRRDMFLKVGSFSSAEFDKFGAASLITRTTNDMSQIQIAVAMGLRIICMAPIMGAGGVIMALKKSLSMGWIIALAVIILIGIVFIAVSLAMPKFKIIQKLVDKLNLVARENLTGLMVIRAFGTKEHETKRFDAANRDLADAGLYINRVMAFLMPAIMLVMNGISLLIVWVGARHIAASDIQVGDMMAFMQYSMQIIMSFLMMAMMFILIPRASVSAVRIAEVLETEISITDPENPKEFDEKMTGVVEFKNVSFKYGNAEEYVLSDISFTARPGQTTAFIGSTGSGKSTLVNLIPRFYDVTEGQILISGRDVRDVTQYKLREQIGYVPQKGALLSGTIASNLRYGRADSDDGEIRACAEIAQAAEFIGEKEEGYESVISEGGANVSGGQKQRLSIARALVKKAPIYIFDDSFSALDFKTDIALRRALAPYTESSTVLIVAQRVSTIKNADQIIVLEHGKIVGIGTHTELLSSCLVYAEIATSQFSKGEL